MTTFGLDEREEQCRLALDKWMRLHLKQSYSWISESHDPPDIWFKHELTTYGIEYTSIHGNAPSGMPGKTVSDSLDKIGEKIAKAAVAKLEQSGFPLKHNYILSLGPDWTGNKINRKHVENYFIDAICTHYVGWIEGNHDVDVRLLDIKPSNGKLTGIGFSCSGPKVLNLNFSKPNIIIVTEPHGRMP